MGRKKKRAAPSEADRIFCYYCERKFQTEQILLSHQKEKHLRCPTCSKRLFSISGLVIHSSQVHNVQVTSVPNAIEGRTSTAVDVVGMKGIPASYYHQQPAKAARTDPTAPTPPTPVYDAPPPSAPAYPQYPAYAQGTAHSFYPPYGSAPYGAPTGYSNGYANGYGNGYANNYANGYPQHYHGNYPTYPQQYSHPRQTYAPVYPNNQREVQQPAGAPVALLGDQDTAPVQPMTSGAVSALPASGTGATKLNSETPSNAARSTKTPQQVKVVFDMQDVSMEEMRAKLPRYKLA